MFRGVRENHEPVIAPSALRTIATGEVVLEARDLTRSYPIGRNAEALVLGGISMEARAGEMIAIVGPSGSGKTTLLACLSGLEAVTSGSVAINGVNLQELTAGPLAKFRRGRIGFVFQSYNLLPALTARENVAVSARLARRWSGMTAVDAALRAVGVLDQADLRPAALSGGQQQRVAIARVLVNRPQIVFADEPTGALDTTSGRAVLDLLRASVDDGRTVIMVTHDLNAAARADRVVMLRDGAIQTVLDHPTADVVFAATEAPEGRR